MSSGTVRANCEAPMGTLGDRSASAPPIAAVEMVVVRRARRTRRKIILARVLEGIVVDLVWLRRGELRRWKGSVGDGEWLERMLRC